MSLLSLIREKQETLEDAGPAAPLPQRPEMLLIGCVDARKDPMADLGIPRGRALILRNVAALVHPEAEGRLTESAALAFAVREVKVKHLVVMGHTACGGIRAAINGSPSYSLRDYLDPISVMRDRVCAHVEGVEAQAAVLEREAVKYSVRALRTYDYITAAEGNGDLMLHGWVIDIATGIIHVWDERKDQFIPMSQTEPRG